MSNETDHKVKETLDDRIDVSCKIRSELKKLRRKLEKIPGFFPRTDDEFLLRFLRCRKHDHEKAADFVKRYYQVRQEKSELLSDLKPSRVIHLIDSRMLEILRHKDQLGRTVLVWRAELWDIDRFPVLECLKLLVVILLKLAKEEDNQTRGLHLVGNAKGLTWKHASQFNPSVAKTIYTVIQNSVPVRFQRVDFVQEPVVFEALFSVVKPILKEKQLKKMSFNGSDLKALHSQMDPQWLPTDLGGKREPFEYHQEWFDDLIRSDREFEEDNKFGFVSMTLEDEKKRKRENRESVLHGLGGSFRKLEL